MSNGDGSPTTAVDQRIEHCQIHHNGDPSEPGYNHNLYLGGTSVTLRFCEVHSSLTGHNVKSRAHHTRVEYCYVHDSANREFDLVDAAETARPESHAVLLGNIIVKDPKCQGNRAVIHFGQDGGKEHDGTLYLAFNTIVTPFISPVVDLSAPKAKASLVGQSGQRRRQRQSNQVLASARNGASLQGVTGSHNWLSGGFGGVGGTRLDPTTNVFRRADFPLFVSPAKHDYHLTPQAIADCHDPFVGRRNRPARGAGHAEGGSRAAAGLAIPPPGSQGEAASGEGPDAWGLRPSRPCESTLTPPFLPLTPLQ